MTAIIRFLPKQQTPRTSQFSRTRRAKSAHIGLRAKYFPRATGQGRMGGRGSRINRPASHNDYKSHGQSAFDRHARETNERRSRGRSRRLEQMRRRPRPQPPQPPQPPSDWRLEPQQWPAQARQESGRRFNFATADQPDSFPQGHRQGAVGTFLGAIGGTGAGRAGRQSVRPPGRQPNTIKWWQQQRR